MELLKSAVWLNVETRNSSTLSTGVGTTAEGTAPCWVPPIPAKLGPWRLVPPDVSSEPLPPSSRKVFWSSYAPAVYQKSGTPDCSTASVETSRPRLGKVI